MAATLALFFALGGTAWAAHNYLITSTSQIAPKVLAQLRGPRGRRGRPGSAGQAGDVGAAGAAGAAGTAGATGAAGSGGAAGATGSTGPTGATGPAGPGAALLTATQGVGSTSSPVGTIPVELTCTQNGSSGIPIAGLQTTRTISGGALGFVAASWHVASGAATTQATDAYVYNNAFPTSGVTQFASNEDTSANAYYYSYGTALLSYTNTSSVTDSETVTFNLLQSGSGAGGFCIGYAQIVPSG